MQYDMHYYGTYALAAAAGIPRQDAEVIATCAQLVDDHNFDRLYVIRGEDAVEGVATAHHPLDSGVRLLAPLRTHDDSRKVWVPFHFLPGNEGGNFHERMMCRKNSGIARRMMDFYTEPASVDAHRAHGLHLMGVAAHVYADTFAHYGFLGISSNLNTVIPESIEPHEAHSADILKYLRDKYAQFAETFLAAVGGAAELGHGAVATYPDRPYLRWSFKYGDGRQEQRNNPNTFMEACENLHDYFARFAVLYYNGAAAPATPFAGLRDTIAEILAVEAPADGRVEQWRAAMAAKRLPGVSPCAIYDSERWIAKIKSASRLHTADNSDEAHAYNFFAAASYHQNYVLKRLLPEAGLFVA